jgi:multiple sugar transport system ATP-binding protein
MAEIRLENITKRFGTDVLAVDNLSLTIEDGEFLVLLGPSGCGKTTTLRMVAGLETQTEGDIYIGDRRVSDLKPGDRDIAFVFQFYALYPHLSVRDNISFPLRAQSLPKAEVDRRVNDVAKRLRIEHILRRRPSRLPGGEQQRVALGRAMVRKPQVFLMDEPLTNLDASLRADMRVELKHLQHELNTTMIYVTHDQIEAMSMSHRIAVLDKGLLQQVDTPLNIYNHPSTLFVATFIGSPPMNIVPCRREGTTLYGDDNDFTLDIAGNATSDAMSVTDLYFGVRAENLALSGGDPTPGGLRGEILVREPLGDETIYLVDMGGYTLTVSASPKTGFRSGDHVNVTVDPKRIHLFDKQTEKSLIGGRHGELAG